MALFWLLREEGYPFEVAHVDHGWRAESGEEAEMLRELCVREGVPFHLKRLAAPEKQHNLEEQGREARLAFFREVVDARGLGGVLLAHQADDAAETVLKRVLEGASLGKLRGMVPLMNMQGMTIYRPLLQVPKNEIIDWLQKRGVTYFHDSTNRDPRFLRTRLRNTIIPLMASHFGKEIASSLCKLGVEANELSEFLEPQLEAYRKFISCTETEVSIDFQSEFPASKFLRKAILRDFFDVQCMSISHNSLETILNHLERGSCHKSLRLGQKEVLIDRKKLTIVMGCSRK